MHSQKLVMCRELLHLVAIVFNCSLGCASVVCMSVLGLCLGLRAVKFHAI